MIVGRTRDWPPRRLERLVRCAPAQRPQVVRVAVSHQSVREMPAYVADALVVARPDAGELPRADHVLRPPIIHRWYRFARRRSIWSSRHMRGKGWRRPITRHTPSLGELDPALGRARADAVRDCLREHLQGRRRDGLQRGSSSRAMCLRGHAAVKVSGACVPTGYRKWYPRPASKATSLRTPPANSPLADR